MNKPTLFQSLLAQAQSMPAKLHVADLAAPQFLLLQSGQVDIFLSMLNAQGEDGARHHVLRMEAGDFILLPQVLHAPDWRMLAAPDAGAQWAILSMQACLPLLQQAQDEACALLHSAARLIGACNRISPPNGAKAIGVGECKPEQDQYFFPAQDDLCLILQQGNAQYQHGAGLAGPRHMLLPHPCWIKLSAAAQAEVVNLSQLSLPQVLDGVQLLSGEMLEQCAQQVRRQAAQEQSRLQKKRASEQQGMQHAMSEFAGLFDDPALTRQRLGNGNALVQTCNMVGAPLGLEFVEPPIRQHSIRRTNPVQQIAEASGVRFRQVALRGAWWEGNYGPLLGFDNKEEVWALMPHAGGYRAQHPDGREHKVDEDFAAELRSFAFMFYRALPWHSLHWRDLVNFVLRGVKHDLWMTFIVGMCAGLLGMAIPIATGHLFQNVFPAADRAQMWQVVMMLFITSAVTLLFNITRAWSLLRVESKAGSELQAAIWDRVLRLPAPFFRDYQAGDLALRINSINEIRRMLSGTFIATLLSSLFSFFNVFLLFYYSVELAWAALGLVLFATAVNFGIGWKQMRHMRPMTELNGKLGAITYEFLHGIAKLRVTGAEWRAFARWASRYAEHKRYGLLAGRLNIISNAFSSVFPVLANMLIFSLIIYLMENKVAGEEDFRTGDFIAFNAAFAAFLATSLALSRSVLDLLEMLPLFERTKPLLEATPEGGSNKPDPGELNGALEVSNLSFAYRSDGPLILNDVSLSIKAGEFVALVGSSGSGKSTLFRLLLGFEKPISGGIYYDGHNLDEVNLGALRRQLGVVLQGGQLMSGDLFSNIVGSSGLRLDDAWAAARACGLDKDIEAMPMGMHTMIDSGGGALSGGQRQRLLIARAIVNRPRVIFFDEATSALDNQTQAIVSKSIEQLHATRIVIAHRLSTIINADRIYVLDKGRIVQSGNYAELMQQEGLFVELAKRQIA
ncbi:NHLP bacteriocin export ABC transporter permease/ATPase subunit [Massilia sp. W12]|uniref:NHLP bacteriocin export ABC transporter permease/ATPase subunit n=1 Tax=Massilia sp. W12 TaxID=3126507 RepID=UPI0030D56D64